MKKKLTIILAIIMILTCTLFTACSNDADKKTVVAKVDGEKIFKSEYNKYWDNVKAQITVEILNDKERAKEIKEDVLKSIVKQKVMKKELEDKGYYNISEEEHNQAKASRDNFIQNMLSQEAQNIQNELGEDKSEKNIQRVTLKYTEKIYEKFGITEQELIDIYIDEIVISKAKRELVNISVTDDDIKAKYDEYVEHDKKLFKEDLGKYEAYKMQGYKSYYIPEGQRMVRHVLIGFDDEVKAEIRKLRTEGKDKEAEKLSKTNHEKIKPEADNVYKLLTDGEITFDKAIEEYNDDIGMEKYPEGYAMSLSTTSYVQEFTDAGMALEKIGDMSEPVATIFGYHIIEYTSDVPSGTIDMSEVKESINDELITSKTNEAWQKQLDDWTADHKVEYFFEELKEEAPAPTAEAE